MSTPARTASQGSLLDRLLDDPSDKRGDTISISALRDGLRRDLEGILNTRRRFLSWSDDLDELDRSLLSYGLSDFTNGAIKSDAFRSAFVAEVQGLIQRLEPRITNFEVSIIENKDAIDRILRFRIIGFVDLGGDRQQISFDSHVDPVRCVVVRD